MGLSAAAPFATIFILAPDSCCLQIIQTEAEPAQGRVVSRETTDALTACLPGVKSYVYHAETLAPSVLSKRRRPAQS